MAPEAPDAEPGAPDLRRELATERALRAARYPLDELVAALQTSGRATLTGASGAWLGLVLADITRRVNRPVAVIVPGRDDARIVHETMAAFLGDAAVTHLHDPDTSPWAGVSPDRNATMQRLAGLRAVATASAGRAIIGSGVAWSRRSTPHDVLERATVRGTVDGDLDVEAMRRVLVDSGYSHVSLVEDPGSFSIRGDLVDIYAPDAELPVRIELYGDMIERIRRFDPVTQRSGDELTSFAFGPAREEILSDAQLATARERLTSLGSELRVPSSRVGAILRDLNARHRYFGIESMLPGLHARLSSALDRLPDDAVVVMVEPDDVDAHLERYLDARADEYEREIAHGELAFAPSDFYDDLASLHAHVDAAGRRIDAVRLGPPDGDPGVFAFRAVGNDDVERLRKERRDAEGIVHAVLELIEGWRDLYGRLVFMCSSRGAVDRLAQLLTNYGVDVDRKHEPPRLSEITPPPLGAIEVRAGTMRQGFRSPARGLAVITDRELLGRSSRRAGREVAQEATAVSSFRELQVGDLVVHVDFGVGRYAGLERMDAGGADNDFLAIEYADGDRLYLPVYRLGKVQKYVGSATFARLDRLGGTSWEKTKAKVKRQLADIAGELLRVQAERRERRGFAFSEPDDLFREFEAAFPYEETPHQQQAIDDVILDMISEQPMDRLLCGDVGFGKTEVAIRAAFKAVVDGRQVAVLVPTTVLAEQHLSSFKARFRHTAARVEAISRFRSPGEVKRILADLADGKVDVIIGTHRLLSKDVEYRDLGLLVVDEEQRFGVTHKEKIKSLRATIDVLTMTATPIPRTLEMSLLGIRDLSVILTPPAGRLAVRTHVARFTENVIAEAIRAELQRGGQAFFVHNRVETIHNVAAELQRWVPELRVGVGHAQMNSHELEQIMLAFTSRELDVLVTTTIIESGIDIANANTIFIHDAHRFGLAQLHQLRGRVGRGSDRAYCYLLVSDPRKLSDDARRRLDVIQQHTDLGAGLQIAHQDLDMRGAGNILGRDQSGHIESIGFELFSELLEEAIAEIQGEPIDEKYEPEVNIPVAAYIPEDYVRDLGQRLAFYKRFSMAIDEEQLFDVHGELEDRYGRAPQPVLALRSVVQLKLLITSIRAKKIEAGPKSVLIELMPDTVLDPDRVIALIESRRGEYEFRPEMTLLRYLKPDEATDTLAAALHVAHEVISCTR